MSLEIVREARRKRKPTESRRGIFSWRGNSKPGFSRQGKFYLIRIAGEPDAKRSRKTDGGTLSEIDSILPEPSWLVWHHQDYSGLGACIVMESISQACAFPSPFSGSMSDIGMFQQLRQFSWWLVSFLQWGGRFPSAGRRDRQCIRCASHVLR
jgi:hypothetical protein